MPTYDVGRVRHAMDLMHYSKASNGSSIPSNWIPAATGDSGIGWQPAPTGGGSVSYGSNSSAVAEISIVGTLTDVARADHYHAGVNSITSSSSNTLQRGVVNFRAGSGIAFGDTDTDGDGEFDTLTISTTSGGGGGGGGGGSLTVQNPDASTTVAASTLVVPAVHLTTSGSTATLRPDPVRVLLGAPDTSYEFDTSSLSGLTAIGSPTTEDANTTVKGALYYKDSTSSTAWMGRYQASPSTPFTIVTCVLGENFNANFMEGGLLVGVADPTTGAFVTNAVTNNNGRKFVSEKFTNRTTFSSTIGTEGIEPGNPVYLAMVVNSTTSIDYYYSRSGYVWRKWISANNPSLTVGSVALGFKSENSNGASIAFDFFYIYNSAKTFI